MLEYLRNKLQWNHNRNLNIFIQENAFENVIWKMTAICLGLNVLTNPAQCTNSVLLAISCGDALRCGIQRVNWPMAHYRVNSLCKHVMGSPIIAAVLFEVQINSPRYNDTVPAFIRKGTCEVFLCRRSWHEQQPRTLKHPRARCGATMGKLNWHCVLSISRCIIEDNLNDIKMSDVVNQQTTIYHICAYWNNLIHISLI